MQYLAKEKRKAVHFNSKLFVINVLYFTLKLITIAQLHHPIIFVKFVKLINVHKSTKSYFSTISIYNILKQT